jgi:hypothetical protein
MSKRAVARHWLNTHFFLSRRASSHPHEENPLILILHCVLQRVTAGSLIVSMLNVARRWFADLAQARQYDRIE